MQNLTQQSQQIQWINYLKGIGIVLVVAGHVYTNFLSPLIFSFHMPLFFFIGGYLLSVKDPKEFLISKANHLLIPYLSFIIIFIALWTYTFYTRNQLSPAVFTKLITDSLLGGKHLAGWQGVFWFVTVFFVSQQILNFICYKTSNNQVIFSIMVASLTLSYLNQTYLPLLSFPLGINIVLFALPIMYMGKVYRETRFNFPWWFILLASIAIIYFYHTDFSKMKIDLKYTKYGIPVISLFIALIFIELLILFSKDVGHFLGSILKPLSSASMMIMFTHQYFHFKLMEYGLKNETLIFIFSLLLSFGCYLLVIRSSKASLLLIGVKRNSAQCTENNYNE